MRRTRCPTASGGATRRRHLDGIVSEHLLLTLVFVSFSLLLAISDAFGGARRRLLAHGSIGIVLFSAPYTTLCIMRKPCDIYDLS